MGEQQYLNILKEIIDSHNVYESRSGLVKKKFVVNMRFDLGNSFPLLTTKRMAWKCIVCELLWMIRGQTDSKILEKQGINIWKANGSRSFLDSRGLFNNRDGDLGPVYGFQWRHYGAEYRGCEKDYSGQGIDQLANMINLVKNDSSSRRLILNSWNAAQIDQMALPPCHVMVQFNVSDGKLNSHLTQRSGDMGLGVPFNIASYSLLTCIVAQLTGLEQGEFCYTIADAHVYMDHIPQLLTQIEREPLAFPTIDFVNLKSLETLCNENIILNNYNSHCALNMHMSV